MFIDLSLSLPADHPIFTMVTDDGLSPQSLGHVGTHLDTYLGVPIPIDWCDRRGVLIDARPYGAVVPESAIDGLDIRAGDFVILPPPAGSRKPPMPAANISATIPSSTGR